MTSHSNLRHLEAAAAPYVRLEKLPTNTTTRSHPVHRWFNFIAGFSPELVQTCMDMTAASGPGITQGVYSDIRRAGFRYLNEIKEATQGFHQWNPEWIKANPHTLPLLQHLCGIFSKAALKKQIGSVSDNSI